MYKIVHLTSVHARFDTRIFLKMCCSLAKKGMATTLIVADGNGDEIKEGVSIVDVGARTGGRLSRMTQTVSKVYNKALTIDADIYHLHDPELIPIGLKLKKLGKKVIFDAHEDLPKQLRAKPYLNNVSRWALSNIFSWYEKYTCSKFDAIVCATPCITEKFLSINRVSININNYPILGELSKKELWNNKADEVCYLGGIAEIRGIRECITSLSFVADNVKLNLAGKFSDSKIEQQVKGMDEWSKVNELGFLNRQQVANVLARSKAGVVTFHELPNHVDAQPNKMFEYMSAGLPLITSNFPLWKEIVEKNECGICVDPLNPREIAEAINYIISHPIEAKKMSENGLVAVQEKYNWSVEENKLIELYKRLLN